jgi:excisionase family DNA binding protein
METTDKRGFSMNDACTYIGGVSRDQMYKLMTDEDIHSYMIGNRRYFLREELDKFLDRMSDLNKEEIG